MCHYFSNIYSTLGVCGSDFGQDGGPPAGAATGPTVARLYALWFFIIIKFFHFGERREISCQLQLSGELERSCGALGEGGGYWCVVAVVGVL